VVLGRHDDVELITAPAPELLAAMRSRAHPAGDETPPSVRRCHAESHQV
jgi:hypothetical protein